MSNIVDTLGEMWSWWSKASNKQDEFFRLMLTISLTILAVFWFLWNVKKPRKVIAPLPPGPRGLPLVGYLPFLGIHLHHTFTELAGIYGPIYKFWVGKKLWVVVSSPTLAKEVVRDQDAIFANRDPPIAGMVASFGGNDIAMSSYGPDWRKLRKIFVREMLSNASLDGCYSLRRQEVEKAIRELYNKIGTPVDVGEYAFLTVMNAVTSMLWGGTLRGDKGANIGSEFRNAISELFGLMGKPNVSDFFPVLARFDMLGIERKAKKIMLRCEKIFDSVIEQRDMVKTKEEEAGKNKQKNDFLQILLDCREHNDTATSITPNQLKALLMDIVVGGTDTTSTMVEWVMAKLMQHPEIMKKVNEELTEVVGMNNVVEEFHLPKLHYLDAVVKETFRLHPALPVLVQHCPSQSCILGGYTIPKGANVFLNAWAMHRDPQYWDNPLDFQPERFLNNPNKFDFSGNNFHYYPFGSGRRICAGLPLAEIMLMYVLASFLHMFEWKMPYGTKLEFSEKSGIVTKKMTPLVAIPTPRLS